MTTRLYGPAGITDFARQFRINTHPAKSLHCFPVSAKPRLTRDYFIIGVNLDSRYHAKQPTARPGYFPSEALDACAGPRFRRP